MKRLALFLAALWLGLAPVAAFTTLPLTGAGRASAQPYPLVISSAATAAASTTTAVVSLPGTYVAGDMLMVLLKLSSGDTFTTPSGWTNLAIDTSACGPKEWVYWKVASGSEGSTVSITQSGTSTWAGVSYSIRNYSGSPAFAIAVSSSFPSPNPPSLTSGFGAVPTLWIAHIATNTTVFASYPSGYVNGVVSSGASSNISAAATKATTAVSEDPGTFSGSGTAATCANTLAVKGP